MWNNLGGEKEESDEFLDDDLRSKSPTSESSLVGYEIAPGIGSVVRSNEDVPDSYKVPNVDIQTVETTTKKVCFVLNIVLADKCYFSLLLYFDF